MPRLFRTFLTLCVVALAAAFVFAACNDDDDGGDDNGGDTSGVPELEDGVLNVGSDIAYAPFEFFEEGTTTPDGLDIDLAEAIAAQLGVEIEFLNIGFDGIIPSLDVGDFDVLISAMTITDERSEVIDFVPYITVGTGIVVPAGNPDGITGVADLCGKTVAVQIGTIQVDILEVQNALCAEEINIVIFDTNPVAVEDVRTGGSDANFSDFPVAAEDAALSDGALEVVDTQIDPEPYGLGVRKTSTELNQALADALQAIIDNGIYAGILADWDLEAVALQ
ncbi:MAG: ABC transporter substrate-binding protein [Chloroflexi bacterium]|nr:ABC transporter substrate-binding protein [Chloroflexota bacterium]MCI0813592.1 ABC transporter substrate-binding protein [Chloroflexota bacterium]MCI0817613.1 ABC transporter substrate-binding protein [Chloroflexota bacterium]MCI0820462.1 ABC transporter substrate-binding protein [Chloroflexota bacterium]MCI0832339.1 ABC transporter substrate-binding protein [Chloroflexota bacterium]